MKTFKSILAAVAVAALAIGAAQAASAAIVNTNLGSLGVPSFTPFGDTFDVGGSANTFQFDFQTASAANALFAMQDQNGGPESIEFQLETCTGLGIGCTNFATSANTIGATIPIGGGTLKLPAGFWRLETVSLGVSTDLAGSMNGSIKLEAIPEPATWAMLILGLGLIGFAARRRHEGAAAA